MLTHPAIMPAYPADSMGPDLARTTLELVDIPSPSREEADALRYVTGAIALPLAYGTDEALLYATVAIVGTHAAVWTVK